MCIFCKIAKGEIPSYKIWEDEKHLAFLDINPIQKGHTLVIPKKHVEEIFFMEDKEYLELMEAVKRVAERIKEKLKPKRVGVIVEGFLVPHVHVHLIPLNSGSELYEHRKKLSEQEMKEIVEKLSS